MPTQVLMPALSPTMEEGKLAKWVAKEGDAIKAGDVIAEIETDKATMEVEAVDEGTLGKILVGEGTEGVKVNTPIAVILGEGEDASALQGGARRAGEGGRQDQRLRPGREGAAPAPSRATTKAPSRPRLRRPSRYRRSPHCRRPSRRKNRRRCRKAPRWSR